MKTDPETIEALHATAGRLAFKCEKALRAEREAYRLMNESAVDVASALSDGRPVGESAVTIFTIRREAWISARLAFDRADRAVRAALMEVNAAESAGREADNA